MVKYTNESLLVQNSMYDYMNKIRSRYLCAVHKPEGSLMFVMIGSLLVKPSVDFMGTLEALITKVLHGAKCFHQHRGMLNHKMAIISSSKK